MARRKPLPQIKRRIKDPKRRHRRAPTFFSPAKIIILVAAGLTILAGLFLAQNHQVLLDSSGFFKTNRLSLLWNASAGSWQDFLFGQRQADPEPTEVSVAATTPPEPERQAEPVQPPASALPPQYSNPADSTEPVEPQSSPEISEPVTATVPTTSTMSEPPNEPELAEEPAVSTPTDSGEAVPDQLSPVTAAQESPGSDNDKNEITPPATVHPPASQAPEKELSEEQAAAPERKVIRPTMRKRSITAGTASSSTPEATKPVATRETKNAAGQQPATMVPQKANDQPVQPRTAKAEPAAPTPQEWYRLAMEHLEQGRPTLATASLLQAVDQDPAYFAAWHVLGHAYWQLGQPQQEIEAYRRALQIDPAHAPTWYNLGLAYAKTDQPEPAIRALEQSVRHQSDDADAWFALGMLYLKENKREQATRVRDRLLELDRDRGLQLERLLTPVP